MLIVSGARASGRRYTLASMTTHSNDSPAPLNIDQMVLLVVGAHLRAEMTDRPLAYRLRERMLGWLDEQPGGSPCEIVVCSDLWYLNADELRSRPTISIGAPGVNALTAYLGDKVPSAFAIDGVLCVQLDTDFTDLVAACWGADVGATASAIDAFCERYLDLFMEKATLRMDVA